MSASATALLMVAGCQFDPSNGAALDAGPTDARDVSDGGDLPGCDGDGELQVHIRVNGVDAPLGPGQPYVNALVSDTIELSAAGSCSSRGRLSYDWSVGPESTQIEGTASPDLESEVIKIYSLRPDSYTVRLTIRDGVESASTSIYAVEAHGWRRLDNLPGPPEPEVRDLSVGGDHLWIASKSGAFRADLAAPEASPYAAIEDLYAGDGIGDELQTIHANGGDGLVWLAHKDARNQVWRVSPADATVTSVSLPESVKVRDFIDAAPGVHAAGDRGVFHAADNLSFTALLDDDSHALVRAAGTAYAGGQELFPLPDGEPIRPFDSGNSKLRALAASGAEIWAGSDDLGVARLVDGEPTEVFDGDNSELGSEKIRALAIDGDGDVWAATDAGVSRYKSDLGVWVPLGGPTGLDGRLDVLSIAVDEGGGRRAIYAGSRKGLVILSVP